MKSFSIVDPHCYNLKTPGYSAYAAVVLLNVAEVQPTAIAMETLARSYIKKPFDTEGPFN